MIKEKKYYFENGKRFENKEGAQSYKKEQKRKAFLKSLNIYDFYCTDSVKFFDKHVIVEKYMSDSECGWHEENKFSIEEVGKVVDTLEQAIPVMEKLLKPGLCKNLKDNVTIYEVGGNGNYFETTEKSIAEDGEFLLNLSNEYVKFRFEMFYTKGKFLNIHLNLLKYHNYRVAGDHFLNKLIKLCKNFRRAYGKLLQ